MLSSPALKRVSPWYLRIIVSFSALVLLVSLIPTNANNTSLGTSGPLRYGRNVDIKLSSVPNGKTISLALVTKSQGEFYLAAREDSSKAPKLIVSNGSSQVELTATEDAHADSYRSNRNYGTTKYLLLDGKYESIGYLKFELDAEEATTDTRRSRRHRYSSRYSSRTNSTSTSANFDLSNPNNTFTLRVHPTSSNSTGFDVFATGTNWSERTITYDNKPEIVGVSQSPTTTRATTTTTRQPTTTTRQPATTTTRPATTTTRAPATTTPPPPSGSSGVSQPVGPSGTWRLHFNDEFNGSSLNTSVWNANWLNPGSRYSPPINGHEGSCYDKNNVSVSGGHLVLKVESRNDSQCRTRNRQAQYASGMVESYNGFRWTYGYAEARILTPASNGRFANFPAFWSNGNSWPRDGEIDIFEGIEGYATHNYHHSGGSIGSRDANAAANARAGQWNTYGVLWEPGRLEFYVNGVHQRTVTSNVVSSSHYLILNHGIIEPGSSWDWAGSRVPNTEMRVDWVRVWKR